MSVNKAKSIREVISKLTYIAKKLDENESAEDFAISMMIADCVDYLRDIENPWHTGEPTEEGCFYVLQCKGKNHPEPYYGVVVDGKFSAISYTGDLMPLPPDLIAWRKIELYKKED